jgi:hypothetical protein
VEIETGRLLWGPERNEGTESAAILYADGRLYFRYQDGRMILLEATRDGYREHGSFMIPDVEKQSWAHPVISDGGRADLPRSPIGRVSGQNDRLSGVSFSARLKTEYNPSEPPIENAGATSRCRPHTGSAITRWTFKAMRCAVVRPKSIWASVPSAC